MERIETEGEVLAMAFAESGALGYYLVIDGPAADEVRFAAASGQWLEGRRGFGSARVTATIGETVWQTSVFPHKDSGGWFLPIKAAVRKAQGLEAGDRVAVILML